MNIINHNLVYSIYQRLHRLYLHDHDRLTFRRTEFQSDLLEKWMMDTRYVDKQLSETDKKTTPVETTGIRCRSATSLLTVRMLMFPKTLKGI